MSIMMLWTLVKKDFLLAKRFTLLVLGVGVVIALFMEEQSPELGGIGVFLFMTLYTILILGQYVTSIEEKYAGTAALLFATPYTRRDFVMAKYLFLLIGFAGCTVLYAAMSLIPVTGVTFGIDAVVVTLLILSIVSGILLPVQFKLGVEKTRFLFLVVLFGVSFGAPSVLPYFARINLPGLVSVPGWAYRALAVAVSALCFACSARISMGVYEGKEF